MEILKNDNSDLNKINELQRRQHNLLIPENRPAIWKFPEFHLKCREGNMLDITTTGTDDEIFSMFAAYFKNRPAEQRETVLRLIVAAYKAASI